MKLIWADVTPDDIANGTPGDALDCPLQRGLVRKLQRPVSVGARQATVDWQHTIVMTDRTLQFRRAYDRSEPVTPGRYAFRCDDYVASRILP